MFLLVWNDRNWTEKRQAFSTFSGAVNAARTLRELGGNAISIYNYNGDLVHQEK